MYTEIIKIIEGGLAGDKEKVANYSAILVDTLEKQGEVALPNKIRSVLSKKTGKFTSLDSFSTQPVDTESRMNIVEVSSPQIIDSQIILSKYVDEEIKEFIECYRQRDNLLKAGLEISNTLLLYGPPGCGKTTTAQYISSITGLPLVTARLDGLVSSLLGSTAKNIRKIFDYTSKRECILFLDEFDVIAKLRDDKNELGELKRVVNSLIQNIDGMNSNSILIAATNHHELLDPAIWRRFSKVITLEKPQKDQIGKLLRLYLKNTSNNILDNPKNIKKVENCVDNLSHSDIETIINNTIKKSIIKGSNFITSCDVFREIYFHQNHSIDSEDEFIHYLLRNDAPHQEIHESLGIPLRRIQAISRMNKGEV